MTIHAEMKRLLMARGEKVGEVVRCESPGDSGGGCYSEVLFVTPHGEAKRALIRRPDEEKPEEIVIEDGWEVT